MYFSADTEVFPELIKKFLVIKVQNAHARSISNVHKQNLILIILLFQDNNLKSRLSEGDLLSLDFQQ